MIGVLVALLCALCWAIGSVSMKDLSTRLDPFTLNAPRALIAGLALFALSLATGRSAGYRDLTWQGLAFMIGSMAVGGGLGDSLYVLSMARIGLSRAYPLAATYPALTLVIGALFLNEQITAPVIAGLALVSIGILVISHPHVTDELPLGAPGRSLGILLALLASACWAGALVMLDVGIQGVDPILVASIRVPALALMFWALVAIRRTGRRLLALSRRDWAVMCLGGLVGWGLGSLLFVAALSYLGPGRTAILTSTSPLFALPLCALFLKERVHRGVLLGAVLTVTGVALVS